MATPFSVIVEDFDNDLGSLRQLVDIASRKTVSAATRVTLIHATTLMLASVFEEFVREMARESAIQLVRKANSVADLPVALLSTAWNRTFGELARNRNIRRSRREMREVLSKQARPTVTALWEFIERDISQDIFSNLIHNENNMRPTQINQLFKISDLTNVCKQVCDQSSLKAFFEQEDVNLTHGDLLDGLEKFFDRRNEVAHSLNSAKSSAPDEITSDIDMLAAFSKDLGVTLDVNFHAN